MEMLDKNGKVALSQVSDRIRNGYVGRRVDGSSIVSMDLGDNPELVELLVSKDVDAWDQLWDQIPSFDPRGEIHVDWLVIDGKPVVFH